MRDLKSILIMCLMLAVIALVLLRRCDRPQSAPDGINIQLIYDSLEREIISSIPEQVPDTIRGKDVIKWLEPDAVHDTIWRDGEAYIMEVPAVVDTNAIIEHWKLDALAYSDTLEDDTLRAFIDDTIYQNRIVGRSFRYQLLMPVASTTNITKRNVFQGHLLLSTGMRTDLDSLYRLSVGLGFLMEFKSGTGIAPKYSHAISARDPHTFEVMITQRISFGSGQRKQKKLLSASTVLGL